MPELRSFWSLLISPAKEAMSLHLTFNKMRQSEAVSTHIHDMFEELFKITDNKFPFHVRLNKEGDETYHVGINCNYHSKQLVSNVDDSNL